MPRTVRSTNVDLIRWLNFGHEITAKKLSGITNANYLSKMATGDMDVNNSVAHLIEKALDLPDGWIDRDNLALLKMPASEYEIQTLVSKMSEEVKEALLQLLRSMTKS